MLAADLFPFPAAQLRGRPSALYDRKLKGFFAAGRCGLFRQEMAFQSKQVMTEPRDQSDALQGIEGVLLAHRDRILRFLEMRGAADSAEDLFQDLWMRLTERGVGPVADPLAYVMRAANNLMLDRYRSAHRRDLRDRAWGESAAMHSPSSEASLISREQLALADAAIAATGERPARIFRRFRIDGVQQREIAREMGVSLSTVEADLRKVYAALAALRRQFDAG